MGRKIKKGTKGSSVNYMTRTDALKKLQIGLPQFRKLCILKGVYPREPKKAPKGPDKTYYFRKDILFLMHDPLMPKFRENHAWRKKLTKAKAKKQLDIVASLRERKPTYSLNHLVRERYPTFVDALRDMDDALCHISLFSQMPSTVKIHAHRVANCQRLIQEFKHYIAKTHSLRKVFLSIKGIYYQAEVMGQTITWLTPYQFTQRITQSVDYSVMLSFLEFYEVLMSFANFKLFHTLGLIYPPQLDGLMLQSEKNVDLVPEKPKEAEKTQGKEKNDTDSDSDSDSEDAEGDNEEKVSNEEEESEKEDEEDSEEDMNVFADDETVRLRAKQSVYSDLFKNCVFWIGRETPKDSLEFVIRSFGGTLFWDDYGKEDDPKITHQIVDRPKVMGTRHITREYVQPQWVYDSANNLTLLPAELYAVGEKLPPHLSPFVDDNAQGYIPDYKLKLDSLKEGAEGEKKEAEVEELEDTEDEEGYAEELALEKDGKYEENAPKEPRISKRKHSEAAQKVEEDDQIDTAAALLPSKRRKILNRMKMTKRMREEEIFKLEEKKQNLATGAAFVSKEGVIEYKQK